MNQFQCVRRSKHQDISNKDQLEKQKRQDE